MGSGLAKLCILCPRGVQLILAYNWAKPATCILVSGKGRGGMFLFLLLLNFHYCSSLFPVPLFYLLHYLFYLFSLSLLSLFSLSLGDDTKMTHKGCRVITPQHNQSAISMDFTKLDICIDIVEIWFGIANGQILSRLGGSVGCAVRLETRRSRVQPPLRSATFFRED